MQTQSLLSCPQGHQWDKPPRLNGDRVLCPECGLEMQPAEAAITLATPPPPDTFVSPDPSAPALSPPDHSHRGRFRIIKPHAKGGLGQVSLAHDEELGREVALKEIRSDLCEHPASRQRFVNEAQITGQLEHPNIVPVYALGRDEGGRPYYAMRFVRGRTLHEAIKSYHASPTPPALRDLLRRFIDICHAVAYAHSQGIIHRDLKPSNVMLGDYGETLVVDWGIAKRLGEPTHTRVHVEPGTQEPGLAAARLPDVTLAGQALGTGAYMAPEQAVSAAAAGPPADVFSLGAILHEIISGERVASDTAWNVAVAKALRPLFAVAIRSRARHPQDRYASALDVAAEVERYLADEPVTAYREPPILKAGRWARRHKPAVAAAAALLLTATATLALSNVWVARQRDAKEVALGQREVALQAEQRARADATQHARTAEERLLEATMASGDAFTGSGRFQDARSAYGRSWNLARQLHLPEVAAIAALVRVNGQEPPALLGGDGQPGSAGGFRSPGSAINDCESSPDGRFAFTAGEDHLIRQWDIRTGHLVRTFAGHTKSVELVTVSGDGRLLASGSRDNTLRVWDTRTGDELFHVADVVTKHLFVRPVFSPDGRLVLYYHKLGSLGLWEVPSGRWIRDISFVTPEELHRGIDVASVAFAPDGRHLLVGRACNLDLAETPRLWDLALNQEVRRFEGTTGNVYGITYLPDGRTAVSTTRSKTIIWDVPSARELHSHQGEGDLYVPTVRVLPDGQTLAIATGPGDLIFLDSSTGVQTRQVKRAMGLQHNSQGFHVLADGELALGRTLARRDGLVLVEVREPSEIPTLRGHTDTVMAVAVTPDGRTAVSGSWDGTLRRWDLASGQELSVMPGSGGKIWSVALSPDARQAIAGSDGDNTVRFWDLDQRQEIRRCSGHEDIVTGVAFSPDGATVASSSSDKTVRLWDARSGKQLQVCRGHTDKVRSVTFSPDGQSVVSASFDGTVRVWALETGVERRVYTVKPYSSADQSWQTAISVSPDGKTALVGGYTGNLAKIDLHRHDVSVVPAHNTATWGVAFFPDGKTAVSTSEDGVLKYWDAAAGKPLGSVQLDSGAGKCVVVSPDGKMVITGGVSGTLRVLDLSRPQRYRDFEQQLEQARRALDRDGNEAQAFAAFGDWYAFRGRYDWAIDFFEQGRAGGADVSPLGMARCYWRLRRVEDAHREFRKALERNEAPADYLALCIEAISRSPATAPNR